MNTIDLIEKLKGLSYNDMNEILQEVAKPNIVYCEDCLYDRWCRKRWIFIGLYDRDGETSTQEVTFCSGGRRKAND